MKITYAIHTAKGYLAVQGITNPVKWFQEEPIGWASFAEEEHARNTAEYFLKGEDEEYKITSHIARG
jgi:hypothetical protein